MQEQTALVTQEPVDRRVGHARLAILDVLAKGGGLYEPAPVRIVTRDVKVHAKTGGLHRRPDLVRLCE